ncbi:MAG: ParE family toxin-like protein [Actinomycetota bacterium]
MIHHASRAFWSAYNELPDDIKKRADEAFARLKQDHSHPSLHFKKVGRFRSARIGLQYRALAVVSNDDLIWFWIGTHTEYDRLVKKA